MSLINKNINWKLVGAWIGVLPFISISLYAIIFIILSLDKEFYINSAKVIGFLIFFVINYFSFDYLNEYYFNNKKSKEITTRGPRPPA